MRPRRSSWMAGSPGEYAAREEGRRLPIRPALRGARSQTTRFTMGDQATRDYGMTLGAPPIASAGPITFGPDDVLFLADNRAATIFAIQVADDGSAAPADAFDLADLDTKLSAFLGCATDDLILRDLAVHPRTHNVYLSVMRGRGNAGAPVIVRIDHRDG